MKNSIAVAVVAISALMLPTVAATAKDYTQIGTATVSNVNAKDDDCKPEAGKSATGTATAKSVHQACTDAKNSARATLRGQILAACAKYITSTRPCKNG
jgi:Tfp pilus assembly major pilin PilA